MLQPKAEGGYPPKSPYVPESDLVVRALASAIELARSSSRLVGREDLGLGEQEFARLIQRYFPIWKSYPVASKSALSGIDEFEDLLGLLLEYRADNLPETRWLAHAIAVCCLGDDHLWQDLGMPNRGALSGLLARYFPGLFAQNTQNMRWKKFFYKKLCERQGLTCRSPNCCQCSDYLNCFGPEEGA
ncbi:MAG: nitrogen fixation protein NifQ [Methylohalobius sp.]|nr:nitrogen fixation protein NifQ [Methylohalobius sp.]